MFSSKTVSLFYASVLFFSAASAAPVSQLETRATCTSGASPCICNNALGIRDPKVASNCPTANSFQFVNKASGTDGTVKSVTGNQGALQCDHIVELQFIADEINKNQAICTHFTSAAGKADFDAFFKTINNQPNLEFVEGTVNNAKGKLFSGNTLASTTQKAASGVESYMTLLKASKVAAAAQAVDNKMTTIMTGAGGTGFTGFVAAYNAKVTSVIAEAKKQKTKLAPAAVGNDPFKIIDESASIAAKCKREVTFWGSARDFVMRAVTGKKPAATAATGAACALPPPKTKATGAATAKPATAAATKAKTTAAATKGKTATATKAKTAAAAKGKTATAAKKPATKAAAVKKPATKATTVKKTAAKTTAVKKPAVKKVAAKKPAVKKVAAKKPAVKVAAKKTVKKGKKL